MVEIVPRRKRDSHGLRRLLAAGEELPPEYSRLEVARLLIVAYAHRNGRLAEQGAKPAEETRA